MAFQNLKNIKLQTALLVETFIIPNRWHKAGHKKALERGTLGS